MMMKEPAGGPLAAKLTKLHDSYVWQANAAVAAGREDLALNVAAEFPDEALELIASTQT